jgi:hypothetical protein
VHEPELSEEEEIEEPKTCCGCFATMKFEAEKPLEIQDLHDISKMVVLPDAMMRTKEKKKPIPGA